MSCYYSLLVPSTWQERVLPASLSPSFPPKSCVFLLLLHGLRARQMSHQAEPGLMQRGKNCRAVPHNTHDQSSVLACPPGELWHKVARVAPPWEWWYIVAQAASKPHLLVCTAPLSYMVTFVTSSITPYNENTGICFAATLVFRECLDIYVPPRDIMSCQDFILMALSILIKAVPTCFCCVAKQQ